MAVKFSDFGSSALNSTGFIVGYDSSTNLNIRIPKSTLDSTYQATLVSATNIKTINGSTILGSGNLAVGSVTSVTGTAPVTSSGGATPAISMAAATTSVNGYLTSTDWTTFNNKQATLVSGTNIKTINSTSLVGSGNVAVEPTITAGTTGQYYRGDKTFQTLDKTAVGLSNVDNTSDANKPISSATQTALNAKQATLTLTTTGTSGAATLVGATLNVPQYTTPSTLSLTQLTTGSLIFSPSAAPAYNGEIVKFGTGTLTAGQLYYLNASGVWTLANASAESSSTGMLGIAVGASPTVDGLLVRGYAVNAAYTQTTGSVIYIATTAGALTATAPSATTQIVRVVGYKTSLANTIYLSPDPTWVTLA